MTNAEEQAPAQGRGGLSEPPPGLVDTAVPPHPDTPPAPDEQASGAAGAPSSRRRTRAHPGRGALALAVAAAVLVVAGHAAGLSLATAGAWEAATITAVVCGALGLVAVSAATVAVVRRRRVGLAVGAGLVAVLANPVVARVLLDAAESLLS